MNGVNAETLGRVYIYIYIYISNIYSNKIEKTNTSYIIKNNRHY